MVAVALLLIILSIEIIDSRNCYSESSYYLSQNEFYWNNYTTILDQIRKPIQSKSSFCSVEIIINSSKYDNNHAVILKFNQISNIYEQSINYSSKVYFQKNHIYFIETHFIYICSTNNFCEKNFLDKWIKGLFYKIHNRLDQSLMSMWTSPKSNNLCQLNNPTNKCLSYLCFTIYDELKDLNYEKSLCSDKISSKWISINVKTTGEYINDYRCVKNHCLYKVIYNKIIENNSTYQSKRNQTNSTDKYLHKNVFIRTMIIIGILLFIASIAYYIQCQRYKQGYRLATIA